MQIQRDVYVLRDAVKNPIEYVQGTDAIPIIFVVRDFTIPVGSTARVYVEKPSTKAIYNDIPGSISGNKITIEVDKQMMAEAGFGAVQVEIRMGEDTFATFEWPLHIKRSLPPIDSANGSNFLDEYIESLRDLEGSTETATEEAKEAARQANEAASGANTAAGAANEAAGNASGAATNANAAAGAATEAAREANAAAEAVNEAADRADKAAQDIQDKADRGDFTATIEVRDTITGIPGTEASVRNVGTEKNAILDFIIPQGLTGEVENIDTVTVEFQQADTRENIESGETFSTLFGKIKKIVADLKMLAFSEPTNNLAANVPGTALDAVQGSVLSEMLSETSANLLLESIERNGYKDDLLNVSLSIRDHDANKTRLVYNPSTNCPIDSATVLGLWKLYWFNATHVFVEFTEFYPIQGRVWTNFYNTSKWSGWSSRVPQNATTLYDGAVIRYTEGGTTKLKKSIAGFAYLRITYYALSYASADPKTTYYTVITPVFSPATARVMLAGTQHVYTSYFGIDILGDILYSRSGYRVSLSGQIDDYNNQIYILKIEGLSS